MNEAINTPQLFVQQLYRLPLDKQQELLDYAEFLLRKTYLLPLVQPVAQQPRLAKRQVGEYIGQITMSEDFEAPLPEEYWLGEIEK
jgi:hypothetical protein